MKIPLRTKLTLVILFPIFSLSLVALECNLMYLVLHTELHNSVYAAHNHFFYVVLCNKASMVSLLNLLKKEYILNV